MRKANIMKVVHQGYVNHFSESAIIDVGNLSKMLVRRDRDDRQQVLAHLNSKERDIRYL